MHVSHVETWKTGIAGLIAASDYAPTTANSCLSILRFIAKEAKREHQLKELATDGVEDFDVSEHSTYTEEEPNALLPEEVAVFLGTMRELYPQHFAMTYCGFATGYVRHRCVPYGAEAPRPTCCGTRGVFWSGGRKSSARKVGPPSGAPFIRVVPKTKKPAEPLALTG